MLRCPSSIGGHIWKDAFDGKPLRDDRREGPKTTSPQLDLIVAIHVGEQDLLANVMLVLQREIDTMVLYHCDLSVCNHAVVQ